MLFPSKPTFSVKEVERMKVQEIQKDLLESLYEIRQALFKDITTLKVFSYPYKDIIL